MTPDRSASGREFSRHYLGELRSWAPTKRKTGAP